MKILYLECTMGAAGDMLMAALYELCSDEQRADFINTINSMGLEGVHVEAEKAVKCAVTGTHMNVRVNGIEEESHEEPDIYEHFHKGHGNKEHHHEHHTLDDIKALIQKLKLPESVRRDTANVYELIAEAESRVHGHSIGEVHMHEVGALDAIADVAGVCLLIYELGIEQIVVSPVNTGFGQVHCAHGILPVPAPATALLLSGMQSYSNDIEGELCTPTGAALLKYHVDKSGTMPVMSVERIGYGMGRKDFSAANCVRAMLGESREACEEVVEMCCNLDDMTAEDIGYASELLLSEGALDVYTTAIGMKKSRPATMLSVMCERADSERLAGVIFRNTTTIGIREYTCKRRVLERSVVSEETEYGKVRYKEVRGYGVERRKAEYEDLRAIARRTGLSIEQIRNKLK